MAKGAAPRSAAKSVRRVFVALGVVTLVACAALSLAQPAARSVFWAVAFVLLTGVGATGWLLERRLARPLDRLGRDLAVIARDNPHQSVTDFPHAWLGRLPESAAAVQARLAADETRLTEQLEAATARIDEQKGRLEAILLDLSEGVIVCGLDHQVLLYNQAAVDLLDQPHVLGLGRSVLTVLSREPIVHHLDRLLHRAEGAKAARAERFVCAAVTGGRLLRSRLGLMRDGAGAPNGYVLTLADVSAELGEGGERERLLRTVLERQRGMLASLRAAAETLAGVPDLAPEDRATFEQVVLEETGRLCEQNANLNRQLAEMRKASWVMSEIHTGDLIAALGRRLGSQTQIEIVPAGMPDWLFADSLSLLDLTEHLARMLARDRGVRSLTVAVSRRDRWVDLDLIWRGEPVPATTLEAWLDAPFEGGHGVLDGRGVLERHGTDCWSKAEQGEGLIRIPLPPADAPGPIEQRRRPPRPEFYDFELAAQTPARDALRERPLRALSYVVFDVETTGLKLSEGDVPVSIGAVRVVNGRVLPLETFERLINPGRVIPAESVRFHGITDAMVKDKPPLSLVLPQFKRFAADSVLVAHNAAFDMLALQRASAICGVVFDNPVLDTLLISAWLDQDETEHSLDAIARRLGLAVSGRHDAMSDAMLTAGMLVRQIERLEAAGIMRFGQLFGATDMAARLRANQMQF